MTSYQSVAHLSVQSLISHLARYRSRSAHKPRFRPHISYGAVDQRVHNFDPTDEVAGTRLVVADGQCAKIRSLLTGSLDQVLWLDPQQLDPIAAISAVLDDRRQQGHPVEILHWISHGSPGALHLGNHTINAKRLLDQQQLIADWHLQQIALWSCSTGADRDFTSLLSELSGAQVFAANHALGQHCDGSMNWKLMSTGVDGPPQAPISIQLLLSWPHQLGLNEIDMNFQYKQPFGSIEDIEVLSGGEVVFVGSLRELSTGRQNNTYLKIDRSGNVDLDFLSANNYDVFGIFEDILTWVTPLDNGMFLMGGSSDFAYASQADTRYNIGFRVNGDGDLDPSWQGLQTTRTDDSYDGISLLGGGYLVAGSFGDPNIVNFDSLNRLNTDGSLDANWVVTYQGAPVLGFNFVNSLIQQSDGKILIEGDFDIDGDQVNEDIVRINSDGSVDMSFSPITVNNGNGSVVVIKADNDSYIIGGSFTDYGGDPNRDYLIKINSDGTVDTAFNPQVSGPVDAAASVEDGKILVGGSGFLSRLMSDGSADQSFNPAFDFSNDAAHHIRFYLNSTGLPQYYVVTRQSIIRFGSYPNPINSTPSSPPSSGASQPIVPPIPIPIPTPDNTPRDHAPAARNFQSIDTDADGLREVLVAPDGNRVDGNRDGIPDALQSLVTGLRLINDGGFASDYGAIEVEAGFSLKTDPIRESNSDGSFDLATHQGTMVSAFLPDGIINTFGGIVSFTISGIKPEDRNTQVVLHLPAGLQPTSGNAYLRFNYQANRFEEYLDSNGLPLYSMIDTNDDAVVDAIRLTLIDGDLRWDGDGTVNGTFVDPGFWGFGEITFRGTRTNDHLSGNLLANNLIGRKGNDVLTGGLGADFINPGKGRDRIVYYRTDESSAAHSDVVDFDIDDRFDLRSFDGDSLSDGVQALHYIGREKFSGRPAELRATRYGLMADTTGDGIADFVVQFSKKTPFFSEDNLLV
ncbi:MAG: DUF4347 domain-containing protein [Synechococcus sp.]|nr:DUF4347 domain-containing protein [Synechococcus sp.]